MITRQRRANRETRLDYAGILNLAYLTEATEALYSVLTTRGIRLYNAPDLREHVLNAVSIETPRGIRLSEQKTSRKIDVAVALLCSTGCGAEWKAAEFG
jgi:phage terminase large subunit-like protein